MSSRCMSLLPRTTLHSDSEQLCKNTIFFKLKSPASLLPTYTYSPYHFQEDLIWWEVYCQERNLAILSSPVKNNNVPLLFWRTATV
jgi:hypothetical protein